MTLKTSLIITGDSSVAKQAVEDLNASIAALGQTSAAAAAPAQQLDKAQADAAGSARDAAAAQRAYGEAVGKAAADSKTLTAANDRAAVSAGLVKDKLFDTAAAQARAATGADAHKAAIAGLETQIGTIVAAVSSGTGVFDAMAAHGGDIAAALQQVADASKGAGSAIDDTAKSGVTAGTDLGGLGDAIVDTAGKAEGMGGKLGTVASILGGPWGAAIGIGVNLLGGFISGMLEADAAEDAAADGARALSQDVSDLGTYFDQTTGKIKESNRALVQFAILSRANKNRELADQQKQTAQTGNEALRLSRVTRGSASPGIATGGINSFGVSDFAAGANDIRQVFADGKNVDARLRQIASSESSNAKLAAKILEQRALYVKTAREIAKNEAEIKSLETGTLAASLRTSGTPRTPAPVRPVRIDRGPAGGSAAVPGVRADDTAAKAAADAQQQLARDLDQVTARYLPAIAAAKDYADELVRIDALAAAYDPNKQVGLSPEQAGQARVALKAVSDARMADLAMTPESKAADAARASIDGVVRSLGQELAARQTLDPVQRAMAQHQDQLAKLSDAEREAYQRKLTTLYQQDEAYAAIEDATRAAAQAQAQFRDLALDAFEAVAIGGENAGKVIERLAQRIASAAVEATLMGTGPLAGLLKGGTAAPAAARASGVSTQATADLVGKSVGRSVGDKLDGIFGKGSGASALKNAGIGYTAASLTGGSGVLGSAGGIIGGQVAGKFLSSILGSAAGPLGSIAGGILGGVVGNLFKKANYGTASVSSSGGNTSVDVGGNNAAAKSSANALGDAVNQGVAQIAQQLGGTLGDYAVSIGTYKDQYRVSTTGFDGRLGNQGKNNDRLGIVDFGKDGQAEAIAYAIQDAVKDGAVKGLSAAVQKALQSSTDVNKAVAEATKVQALELTMGGITATIDKAFRDFEAQAQERVRLARQYGFDVLAIEKRNGEDRKKLADQLQADQVGSLSKLIEEMTQGSLSEGSDLDRIPVLDKAIARAKQDLADGVEGAGNTLAGLYQQKLAASEGAYGTTGQYAADRTAIADEARAAIAAANARITAAQAGGTKSDPALATTNSTLDEMSDQNAKVIEALNASNALLARLTAAGGAGTSFDLAALTSV